MIKFENLKIDNNVISEIINIGNSCGVVTCYILSLIYDFKFDIEEFKNIGMGLTDKKIQDYAAKNGLNYISKEKNGKSNCSFADFDVLCENDICMTLSGSNTKNNGPHNSILTNFKGDNFTQLMCNNQNCKTKFSEVENIYPTFYYKNCDIDNFVEFN